MARLVLTIVCKSVKTFFLEMFVRVAIICHLEVIWDWPLSFASVWLPSPAKNQEFA